MGSILFISVWGKIFPASSTDVITGSGIRRLTLIFQRITPPVIEGEKCCVKQLYWRKQDLSIKLAHH